MLVEPKKRLPPVPDAGQGDADQPDAAASAVFNVGESWQSGKARAAGYKISIIVSFVDNLTIQLNIYLTLCVKFFHPTTATTNTITTQFTQLYK